MPTTPEPGPRTDREAELIAAAAAEDLTPAEAEEYAALVAAEPGVARETDELRELLGRVDDVAPGWVEPEPSPELQQRVLAIPDAERGAAPPRRRVLPAAAAAVVLLLAGGLAGGLVASALGDETDAPPQGPPGTLGATEPISFEGEPAGVDIEASLVAHTWGTETVLDMDGWAEGDSYQVVLVGTDGEAADSGSFLGSEIPVVCRMNAALVREQVDLVEIRDADGQVVARSDVPEV